MRPCSTEACCVAQYEVTKRLVNGGYVYEPVLVDGPAAEVECAYVAPGGCVEICLALTAGEGPIPKPLRPGKAVMEATVKPNPSSTGTTIYIEGEAAAGSRVVVSDGTGKVVWTGRGSAVDGKIVFEVPTGDLPAGTYYYEVKGSEIVLTRGSLTVAR